MLLNCATQWYWSMYTTGNDTFWENEIHKNVWHPAGGLVETSGFHNSDEKFSHLKIFLDTKWRVFKFILVHDECRLKLSRLCNKINLRLVKRAIISGILRSRRISWDRSQPRTRPDRRRRFHRRSRNSTRRLFRYLFD